MNEAAALREKYKLGNRQVRLFHPVVPPQPQQPAKPVTNVIDMHSHMIPASI